MSFQNTPPSLEQYPGYFPAGKPPFWTRAKVGVASGVLGLLVGVAGASGGEADAEPRDEPSADALTQADVDSAVEEATGSLEQQVEDSEAALRAQEEQAAADLEEARAALTKAKKQAKVAQAKAVARAVAASQARQESAPEVNTFTGSTGGTDPQFDYCYEANDAGYGPYREGEDPEYDWYDDRDGDGLVCES